MYVQRNIEARYRIIGRGKGISIKYICACACVRARLSSMQPVCDMF
jgi:hypothetical protein